MYSIKDEKLSAIGTAKIEAARKSMPVLEYLKEEYASKKPFDGLHIVSGIPVTQETAVYLNVLSACGAKITVVGSGITSTSDDIAAALALSYQYDVFAVKDETMEQYNNDLDKGISQRPDIFLDDGAVFAKRWHEHWQGTDVFDQCKCVLEQTTSGISHARSYYEQGLPYPILNVNDTHTKTIMDNNCGTGQSVVTSIMKVTGCMIRGLRVTIIGYGPVGQSTALYFRSLGASITIVEKDEFSALSASLNGFRVKNLKEGLQTAQIVVTATGVEKLISSVEIQYLKTGCILANAGHDYNEIDQSALEECSVSNIDTEPKVTMFITRDHRIIYLLCHGGVVNLGSDNGCPPSVMDASFSIGFMGIRYLLKQKSRLPIRIHDIPEVYDRKIAGLKLKYICAKQGGSY